MQLASAWRGGQHLVENDDDLVEFSLTEKLKALEALEVQMGADLSNPFGSVAYEEHEDEGDKLTQSQESSTPSETLPFKLLDLADEECAHHNGLSCMVELPDGRQVHKAQVLHEFTKYSQESNLTD